jgi:replicative DNA helicase
VSTDAVVSDGAERTVVGAVLLHPACLSDVSDVLHPDDFSNPVLKAVYEACRTLDGSNRPIDIATVESEMREADTFKMLSHIGGADYLVTVQTEIAGIENLRFHATTIARKSYRRACAFALRELADLAVNVRHGDEVFFSDMDRRLSDLIQSRRDPGGVVKFSTGIAQAIRTLAERYDAKKAGKDVAITGIRSRFDAIDEVLGGWQDGKLYVIAARPRMGKTSLLLNATVNAALDGAHVLGFSLEMDDQELISRALSSDAEIDGKAIERVELNVPEWARIQKAATRLHGLPVWIDATAAMTFEMIRSRARRWRGKIAAGKRALVWVDYLQLVEGRGSEENRQQEITAISRGLKSLAKELRCPVIALSQLNRAVENRDDKRPRLSDLRESGAIEQDADVVAFVYRDEVYSPRPENRGEAEFIVNKNRGGLETTIPLLWDGRYTRFSNAPVSDRTDYHDRD